MKYQHNAGYRIREKIDSKSRAGQVNVLRLESFSLPTLRDKLRLVSFYLVSNI